MPFELESAISRYRHPVDAEFTSAKFTHGFGRLFELVSDAVIVASAETGDVVLWNPGAAKMFGIAAEDAVGMSLERLVPEPLRARHVEGLARYARGEPSHIVDTGESVELPAVRADGSSLWVELALSSVPPADVPGDEARHVVAIIRDVSARKAAEAEVIARNDQLRAANEGLRHFLAAAAHDIVGPAGGMRGAAELISGEEDPGEIAELAGLIVRQADLVIELGHDLGQLASIEQGSVPVRPERIRVSEVVNAGLEAAGNAGTTAVDNQVNDALFWVVDRTHATRIVANLVTNARKYGEMPVSIGAKRSDDHVELRVHDMGAGVADDFVDRLFEKFTRARVAGEGLGLGLAICRGLATANSGVVYYEPSDGPGATFVVAFPERS